MERFQCWGSAWKEIEVIEALRERYGDAISPDVQSVCLFQNKDRIWVTIRRLHYCCEAGQAFDIESVDLTNCELDTESDSLNSEYNMCDILSTDRDICINADVFVSDFYTIMTYTSVFEN